MTPANSSCTILQGKRDAFSAISAETPQDRTAQPNCRGADRESLEHVAATAEPTVDQNRNLTGHCIHDSGKRLDGGGIEVQITRAMIRDNNACGAVVYRLHSVFRRKDSFDQHGDISRGLHLFHIIPSQVAILLDNNIREGLEFQLPTEAGV
jgi:hypothetical protein